jgi:hypothetical protein
MSRTKLPRLIQLAAVAFVVLFSSQSASAEPRIYLDKPAENKQHSGTGFLDVAGTVTDPDGLRSLTITLNGKPLSEYGQRGIDLRKKKKLDDLKGGRQFPFEVRIPAKMLNDGRNDILLRAENIRGQDTKVRRTFVHRAARGTVYLAAIGINRYRDSAVPALKYAEADAHAVAGYFRDHLGVPPENIFTLVGKEATARNIKKLLGVTLRRKAGPNDQVVIYYAGHGVPEFDTTLADGDQVEKYLLPWDGEVDALYATAVPMREVDYLSQRFASDRVVFALDTCFSGSASVRDTRARTLPEKVGLRSYGRQLDDAFLRRMAEAKGKIILTASGINEPSHEIDELGHGAFTYYLLEGLRGQADLDGDGIVGVLEVYKYLNNKVPARTGFNQTPAYFVSEAMEGDIVLGRSGRGDLQIDIPDPFEGEMNVGRLAMTVYPTDSTVVIDNESSMHPRGFLNTTLSAGKHRVKVLYPGFEPKTVTIEVKERELLEKEIFLDPSKSTSTNRLLPGAPPPP